MKSTFRRFVKQSDADYLKQVSMGSAINQVFSHLRLVASIPEKPLDESAKRRINQLLNDTPTDWGTWYLLISSKGRYSVKQVSGRYFPEVLEIIPSVHQIHVFRGDGLFFRSYEKVYTYPKVIDVKLEHLPYEALTLVISLTKKPLRQYENRKNTTSRS